MTNKKYILDKDHNLIEADLEMWSRFFEDMKNRRVGRDEVNGKTVSTVFLGLDHNFSETGEPLLFETMIFGGDGEECYRYSTWDEALKGHNEIVAKLRIDQGAQDFAKRFTPVIESLSKE